MEEINWARWLFYLIVGVPALAWLLFTRHNTLRLLAVVGILIFVEAIFAWRRHFIGIGVGPSVAFVYVAFVGLYLQRGRLPRLGLHGPLLLGFLFAALVGLMVGSFGTGLLFLNIKNFQEYYLEGALFFLVGVMAFDHDDDVNRFLYRFIVFVCGGVAAFHLIFLITGWRPEVIAEKAATVDPTVFRGVIFLHSNTQADFYAMTLPMGLLFFLRGGLSGPRRALMGTVLIAMTISLLLQAARGGLLTTIVMVGVVLRFSGERLGRTAITALAGISLIGGAVLAGDFLFPDIFRAMFEQFSQEGLQTGRWAAWAGFLRMLADYPFGIGLHTENIFATGGRYGTGALSNAHSIYLNIALETGIAGLIVFLALVGSVVRRTWRTLKAAQNPQTRQAAMYLFLALGGFLLGGTVEPIYTNGYKLNQLFWLLLGMSLAISDRALAASREASAQSVSEGAPIQHQALSEHRPGHV